MGTDDSGIAARIREVRLLRGYDLNELGRLAGVSGGEVSRLESGVRSRPGVFAVARIADALRVRLEWLVFGRGPRDLHAAPASDNPQRAPDPPVGTFMIRLGRLPGLQRWVEEHPEAVSVSELLRAMHAYEATPPRTKPSGEPWEGWGTFVHDVLAGNLAPTNLATGTDDPAAMEIAQLGEAGGVRRKIVAKRKKRKRS